MRSIRIAALVAAACLGASGARAQSQTITDGTGKTTTLPAPTPATFSDPNNAAFHGSSILTPSGTAGQAGTIGATGQAVTAGTAGYSFGWVCTGAGLGSITLSGGSVLPYYLFANSGGISRDGYAIVDAEPGSATGCTFWNLR